MLSAKQSEKENYYSANHAGIKHVSMTYRIPEKELESKTIQNVFQHIKVTHALNADVNKVLHIMRHMQIFNFDFKTLKNFLLNLAKGQKDIQLIASIHWVITKLVMFGGQTVLNKRRIAYREIIG